MKVLPIAACASLQCTFASFLLPKFSLADWGGNFFLCKSAIGESKFCHWLMAKLRNSQFSTPLGPVDAVDIYLFSLWAKRSLPFARVSDSTSSGMSLNTVASMYLLWFFGSKQFSSSPNNLSTKILVDLFTLWVRKMRSKIELSKHSLSLSLTWIYINWTITNAFCCISQLAST